MKTLGRGYVTSLLSVNKRELQISNDPDDKLQMTFQLLKILLWRGTLGEREDCSFMFSLSDDWANPNWESSLKKYEKLWKFFFLRGLLMSTCLKGFFYVQIFMSIHQVGLIMIIFFGRTKKEMIIF